MLNNNNNTLRTSMQATLLFVVSFNSCSRQEKREIILQAIEEIFPDILS
jgi:hypothetical protein